MQATASKFVAQNFFYSSTKLNLGKDKVCKRITFWIMRLSDFARKALSWENVQFINIKFVVTKGSLKKCGRMKSCKCGSARAHPAV